jgi:hypothetical protein
MKFATIAARSCAIGMRSIVPRLCVGMCIVLLVGFG